MTTWECPPRASASACGHAHSCAVRATGFCETRRIHGVRSLQRWRWRLASRVSPAGREGGAGFLPGNLPEKLHVGAPPTAGPTHSCHLAEGRGREGAPGGAWLDPEMRK